MNKLEEGNDEQMSIHGRLINNLRFTDDIDLIQKSYSSLHQQMNNLYEAGRQAGLKVNVAITNVFGSTKIERHVKLEGCDIENVEDTWEVSCHEIMTVVKTSIIELLR